MKSTGVFPVFDGVDFGGYAKEIKHAEMRNAGTHLRFTQFPDLKILQGFSLMIFWVYCTDSPRKM
jgi:hypothetical protein